MYRHETYIYLIKLIFTKTNKMNLFKIYKCAVNVCSITSPSVGQTLSLSNSGYTSHTVISKTNLATFNTMLRSFSFHKQDA